MLFRRKGKVKVKHPVNVLSDMLRTLVSTEFAASCLSLILISFWSIWSFSRNFLNLVLANRFVQMSAMFSSEATCCNWTKPSSIISLMNKWWIPTCLSPWCAIGFVANFSAPWLSSNIWIRFVSNDPKPTFTRRSWHSIKFSFGRWFCHSCLLLRWPRNRWAIQQIHITRYRSAIIWVAGPACINIALQLASTFFWIEYSKMLCALQVSQ